MYLQLEFDEISIIIIIPQLTSMTKTAQTSMRRQASVHASTSWTAVYMYQQHLISHHQAVVYPWGNLRLIMALFLIPTRCQVGKLGAGNLVSSSWNSASVPYRNINYIDDNLDIKRSSDLRLTSSSRMAGRTVVARHKTIFFVELACRLESFIRNEHKSDMTDWEKSLDEMHW